MGEQVGARHSQRGDPIEPAFIFESASPLRHDAYSFQRFICNNAMSFFRAYIAPLLIVLTFLFAMVAVSARIFLPGDMLAPAPIEEPVGQVERSPSADGTTSAISWLLQGERSDFS